MLLVVLPLLPRISNFNLRFLDLLLVLNYSSPMIIVLTILLEQLENGIIYIFIFKLLTKTAVQNVYSISIHVA